MFIYAHCYALDCISHVLLGKEGTKSIEEKAGMDMMYEMTYYSTFKTQLVTFYLQPLSTYLLSLLPQKIPTLLTNTHVFSTCLRPSQEPYTLLHTLQHASPPLAEIEIAAEIMDYLAAGIDTTGDSSSVSCFSSGQVRDRYRYRCKNRNKTQPRNPTNIHQRRHQRNTAPLHTNPQLATTTRRQTRT